MGYRWNRHDEPVLESGSKPLLTEFGIESCKFLFFYDSTNLSIKHKQLSSGDLLSERVGNICKPEKIERASYEAALTPH